MGRAKKFKALRKVVQGQAPKIPFGVLKPHYKRMKKVLFGKGGTL